MIKYTYWHEILEKYFTKEELKHLYTWNKLSLSSGFYNLHIPMEEIEKICKKVEVIFKIEDYQFLSNSYGYYIEDIRNLLVELNLDFDLTYINPEQYTCFYYEDISNSETIQYLRNLIQEKIQGVEILWK